MTYDDHLYHTQRERHCRDLAERAADPDVSRRHFELAELHAGRAARYLPLPNREMGRLSAAQ